MARLNAAWSRKPPQQAVTASRASEQCIVIKCVESLPWSTHPIPLNVPTSITLQKLIKAHTNSVRRTQRLAEFRAALVKTTE